MKMLLNPSKTYLWPQKEDPKLVTIKQFMKGFCMFYILYYRNLYFNFKASSVFLSANKFPCGITFF